MQILKPRWNWPAELDFSAVEHRVLKDLSKSGKTWTMFSDFAHWELSPIERAMKELEEAQSNEYGEDPLFEAMERAKNLPKVGISTLKALCTAEPLGYLQNDAPTHGPIKAKDWQ